MFIRLVFLFLLAAFPLVGAEQKSEKTKTTMNLFTIALGSEPQQLGFIPTPEQDPSENEGAPNPSKILEGPPSFALDTAGNFYFLDMVAVAVKKFDPTGKFLAAFPYPVINRQKEYRYIDIQLSEQGAIFLFDAENNLVVELDSKGVPAPEKTLAIPTKKGTSDILVDQIQILADGTLRFLDLSQNDVLEIPAAGKQSGEVQALHTIIEKLTFQTQLHTDSTGRIVGFQGNTENPEILEIFAQKPGTSKADLLFKTVPLKTLTHAEILRAGADELLLAVFTGGDMKSVLSEIQVYDLKGALKTSHKTGDVEELPWRMQRSFALRDNQVIFLEYREKENALVVHGLKL